MADREIKKYVSLEQLKDIQYRKSIHDKYRRYNNIMIFFSIFITISVIFTFMLLFDYQVLKPQDVHNNQHYSERTTMVSKELAKLFNCSTDELVNVEMLDIVNKRISQLDILMMLSENNRHSIYNSPEIENYISQNGLGFAIELLRERYIIERHPIENTNYTMYFFVPKSDGTLIKKNFITFIAAIFIISAILKWGFSRSVMARVYKNMVKPLEKIKKGTNEIRKGNLDFKLEADSYYSKDLRDTFNDFEKMREKLKENKRLELQYENNRKELISNISHDLKTPIASILGYVEGILDGVANTPAKRDRYMQIIYKKSLDMNRLVNDLILFSKLDVNKVAFRFERFKFKDYMDVLFEEYGMELQENNIELVSRYQVDENVELCVDRKQLRRVFNNIIGNAMKHLDKETKAIEMMVYDDNDELVIRISDNGMGISKDKVENIFDRFYRADDSRNTEVGSSGLGLSISKQIVLAHGGRIWAKSEEGQGTTIFFTISKEKREA